MSAKWSTSPVWGFRYCTSAPNVAAAAKTAAEDVARQAGQRRLSQLESSAQMEAKSVVLAAKQACMDEVFAKALETLKALPEAEYIEVLAELLAKACRNLQKKSLIYLKKKY